MDAPLPRAQFDPRRLSDSDLDDFRRVVVNDLDSAPAFVSWLSDNLTYEINARRCGRPQSFSAIPQGWSDAAVADGLLAAYELAHGVGSEECAQLADTLLLGMVAYSVNRLRSRSGVQN